MGEQPLNIAEVCHFENDPLYFFRVLGANSCIKNAPDLGLIIEFESQDAFPGLTKKLYSLEINRKLPYNLQSNKSLEKNTYKKILNNTFTLIESIKVM